MRHRLAMLLRRLAERISPIEVCPIRFNLHGTTGGDVSGTIDESGKIAYLTAAEQQKIAELRENTIRELELYAAQEKLRLDRAIEAQNRYAAKVQPDSKNSAE